MTGPDARSGGTTRRFALLALIAAELLMSFSFFGYFSCGAHLRHHRVSASAAGGGADRSAGGRRRGRGVRPCQHVEGLRQLCHGRRPALLPLSQRRPSGQPRPQRGQPHALRPGGGAFVSGRPASPKAVDRGGSGVLLRADDPLPDGLQHHGPLFPGSRLWPRQCPRRPALPHGSPLQSDHRRRRAGVLAGRRLPALAAVPEPGGALPHPAVRRGVPPAVPGSGHRGDAGVRAGGDVLFDAPHRLCAGGQRHRAYRHRLCRRAASADAVPVRHPLPDGAGGSVF